jgi:hypothetical protein
LFGVVGGGWLFEVVVMDLKRWWCGCWCPETAGDTVVVVVLVVGIGGFWCEWAVLV